MGEINIAGVRVRRVVGTLLVNGVRADVHEDAGDRSVTITDAIDQASFIAGARAMASLLGAVRTVPLLATTERQGSLGAPGRLRRRSSE